MKPPCCPGERGETLHDYRVTVRRIRSLLGQFKALFPATRIRRFRDGFACLARLTSPARDLEVCAAGLAGGKTALEPARHLLETKLEATRAQLLRPVATLRHRRFLESWRRFLDTPAPRRPAQPLARHPIGAVAAKRIRKLCKRAVTEASAIGPHSPPEDLHALRKTCKKPRYVLEFYRHLAPSRKIDRLVRDLKDLQQILGDFQNGAVHAALLRELASALPRRTTPIGNVAGTRRPPGTGAAPPETGPRVIFQCLPALRRLWGPGTLPRAVQERRTWNLGETAAGAMGGLI
jgi:CHAD domain-containing protein